MSMSFSQALLLVESPQFLAGFPPRDSSGDGKGLFATFAYTTIAIDLLSSSIQHAFDSHQCFTTHLRQMGKLRYSSTQHQQWRKRKKLLFLDLIFLIYHEDLLVIIPKIKFTFLIILYSLPVLS